ncbi:hypothetical protein [Roseovarius sp. 2305UL8-3]|uniref:hypothetical protein n=1 Tax=Roseovarius conchicola TaxID=3121636 RepID=UPI003528FE9A
MSQLSRMERMKAILALSAAVAFVMSPFLSPGFNGFRADQFPIPQVDAPAQPAGYAFSIWGLIYLMLLLGTGFGLLNRADHADWDRHRWSLIISMVLGAAWIPVAQLSPFWATVLIWLMLITAIWALLNAGTRDRIWLRTPIALYAGWLTAASAVALALMLAGHGIVGQTTAAILTLGLGLMIASAVQRLRPDTPEYSAAVIWALVAVVVTNLDPLNIPVLGLSLAGIAALAFTALKTRAT